MTKQHDSNTIMYKVHSIGVNILENPTTNTCHTKFPQCRGHTFRYNCWWTNSTPSRTDM